MRKRASKAGQLIVVELGGAWPTRLGGSAEAAGRRVICQQEGESPDQLAERVAAALDGLFGRGIELFSLALACNERLDGPAVNARRKIASLGLGSMARRKRGRAYLSASARSSGRLRHALSALATDLAAEWAGAGLEASVEFGDEARSSAAASYVLTAHVA